MIKETNTVIKEDLESIISEKLLWDKFKNKIILITGGNGFLASYITKSLLSANNYHKLNIKIISLIRSRTSYKNRIKSIINNKNLSLVYHNLKEPLPNNFPKSDFIIHSASQASPKYFGLDPVGTLLPNSIGTYFLLEYAIKCKAEKFLFFSSGEVYGNPLDRNKEIKEHDYGYLNPTILRSCYAESKRIGETMCVAYSKQFNLHTNIVRPFHTYGPGLNLDDGRVFADFVAAVVAKRNIIIKGNGSEKRCFCYLSDATTGFLRILLNGANREAYNLANPSCEISIKNLAKLISNLYPNYNIKVKFIKSISDGKYLKSSITRILPSIKKIKKIGWSPNISLEEGFSKTINSFIL
jgi:nucleoside-diphosphate-sugar epimerase